MNEETKPSNVIHISTAKGSRSGVTKTLSVMSTLSKVAKHRDSRVEKQGKGRLDSRRRELSGTVPQMPFLDNHPSKGSPRDRVAKTVVVDSILADLQITLDVHQSNGITDVVPGLLLAMEVIGDEYK